MIWNICLILWVLKINKLIAKDKEHLEKLIDQEIKRNGPNCDLNHMDVSSNTP